MKKILLYLFAASMIFVLIASITSWAEDSGYKEISVTPFESVKQGQTVFIKIKSSKELENPVFTFKEKQYKIFKAGECEYTGLLGINILEEAGSYTITMSDDKGNLNDNSFINVVSTEYPKQNIVLTKRMSGLGATSNEIKQISNAKCNLTKELMRTTLPYDSPTNGCINSVFGLKRYYNGKFSGNYHKGVDIKAPTGEPVRTITAGKVITADKFRLHGSTVAVDHGHGLMSIYIHLSKMDVKLGDYVKTGQKIGEVGETGFATGPHLHWGLYVNGTPVDPMKDWVKPVSLCK